MANIGFQITGPSPASYSWSASTCGATLANGSSCKVQVGFTPASPGQLISTLIVSSSTAGVFPVQVPLSGIGQTSSGIRIRPAQMRFTQSALGQPSAAQTATISNISNASASGLNIAVSPPFSLMKSSCGSMLQSGATCTVDVIFTPIANGLVTGTLTASATGFSSDATTVLVGTGGAAGSIQTQPSSLSFATTGIGARSPAQTLTLTNTGPVPIASLHLSATAGFEVVSTGCGASLESGGSCAIQVDFAPSAAGKQTGSLTIESPTLAMDTIVNLSGMGFDFTFSSSGPSSQTVPSGMTASYMLTLAPQSGSSGTFSFSCASLPANSSCKFNPASEQIAANTTGTVTLQIATGTSSSARNSGLSDMLFQLPLAACGFVVLPFVAGRRRRCFLSAILSVCLIGITSCAGSGGGGGGKPSAPANSSTPAGTYSVVVTATANSVAHKTTLTLTVD